MAALLLFSLVLSAFAEDATFNTKTCYVCASEELRSRWQLTGLPRISDQYFLSSCNTANSVKNVESCSGPCFTMIFDDPDTLNANGNTQLYVRGCHTTLTQVASDRSTNSGASYCEYDNAYSMSDSRGAIQKVNMLAEFCSTSNCNTRGKTNGQISVYTDPVCAQQTTNLLNNAPLSCYECSPREGSNCNENKCARKYCMKQIVRLGSGYQVMKSCSNVNIIGVDNYCLSNDVTSSPGGVAVQNKYTQCICKDKQFCNGSSLTGSILSLVITVFVFYK